MLDPELLQEIPADLVVTAVGQHLPPDLADHLGDVVGPGGLIATDPRTQRVAGPLFAGGDLVRGAGTIAAAVGDGRRAAAAMDADFRAGTATSQTVA